MTQPLDRTCELPQLGDIDQDKGEFWRTNIFQIANSGDNLSAFEKNRLFFNGGEAEKFLDVSFDSGVDLDSDSRSVIATDFNKDGKPDLLVASVGGGPLRLFENQIENDNRHVEFKLVANSGSVIGTRLIVKTDSHTIYRDLFPHNGCMGQSPLDSIIGIPADAQINSVTVRWPDGNLQSLDDLITSDVITIKQQ